MQNKECSSAECAWKVFEPVPTHGLKERWQVRVLAPERGN